MQYIAPLAKLIEHFRALPGIGNKTAVRLAYHVLDMDAEQAKKLATAIIEAKEKIGYCNTCFNLSDQNPCAICAAEERDHSVICVVEQPQDVAAMERMRDYRGVYHVLNGVISPSKGVMPEDLDIDSLVKRALEAEEVILATSNTMDGETTAMYLDRLLKEQCPDVLVTRIAHGLPAGGLLDYADEMTLAYALSNRRRMQ